MGGKGLRNENLYLLLFLKNEYSTYCPHKSKEKRICSLVDICLSRTNIEHTYIKYLILFLNICHLNIL